jgi:hypothetical protein
MFRNILFFLILICLQQGSVFAQAKPKKPVVYDIVHLKTGKVLYGEIIEFDQKDGDLTFRDDYNRKYSLSREMYDFFEEDVTYQLRVRDTLIRPRKIDEYVFSIGFSSYAAGSENGFIPDSYYLSSNGNGYYYDLPICLNLGIGKYLNRQHYVGIITDVKFLSSLNHFYSLGLNYQFQYDGMTSNVGRYIPIRLNYNYRSTEETLIVPDMTMPPFHSTIQQKFDVNLKSIGLEIGHGFSFIRHNSAAWNLEFCVFKNFVFDQVNLGVAPGAALPNLNYSLAGAKVSLHYSF